jgi:hypothetical protein
MPRETKSIWKWQAWEAEIAAGALIVGDQLSFRTSLLYRHGAPCSDREHVFGLENDDGSFQFSVVPGENSVTVVTSYLPTGEAEWERFERSTPVEWKDTQFNSRRAWIVCSVCANPVNRAFISVKALAGSLLCRRCAGVRYWTQDASLLDRLAARVDALRIQLNGEAVRGITGLPLPPRPRGMHQTTYLRLTYEIVILEGDLSDELRKRAYEVIEEHSAELGIALGKIQRWRAMSGPHSPLGAYE